jgi:hypothetical protein
MDILTKLHLILHIIAGASTLIAGPIAIFFNFKDPKKHRLAGKVFFYAMLYVCGSAIVGYFRHPGIVFYEFLLGIAIIVLAGVLRGVRAIYLMKGDRVRIFDWIYTIGLGLFGIWMFSRGITYFNEGKPAMFPILFSIFGIGSLSDTVRSARMFIQYDQQHRLDWYNLHVMTMIGAMTASTTAFFVNILSATMPWYIVWFGPTLLLLPLQIYYGRVIRGWRKVQVA